MHARFHALSMTLGALLALCALALTAAPRAQAQGSLVAWGLDAAGQVSQTPITGSYIAVAAGYSHNVALRADGSLVAWGADGVGQVSQTPTTGSYTAVAAGVYHNVAIQGANFAFSGFFAPVNNPPVLNTVKAGQGIPVKFSLDSYQCLVIFDAGSPQSQQVVCDTAAPIDAVETTVTTGSSSLTYDPSTAQYNYVWKTDKAWAGTCRQLLLQLTDGTQHMANFKFTK